jgi:Nup85 Nucleoporin
VCVFLGPCVYTFPTRHLQLILRSMPRLTATSSPTGFYTTWQQWHKDANGLLSTNEEIGKYPQLRSLLILVAGDEDALANASVSWYTLLVSQLLYVNPTTKSNELQYDFPHTRSCLWSRTLVSGDVYPVVWPLFLLRFVCVLGCARCSALGVWVCICACVYTYVCVWVCMCIGRCVYVYVRE